MSAEAFEAFLARLYVDENARRRFVADPRGEAAGAGLDESDREALAAIDWVGLDLAAASFGHKRAHRRPRTGWRRWLATLWQPWRQSPRSPTVPNDQRLT